MGGLTVISYDESRNISTNVLQLSNQKCSITCNNTFTNGTYILENVTGSIIISQSCTITDATCAFKTAFEANIENIIQSMIQQNSFQLNGMSFNFDTILETININTIIHNSISQIMNSSCAITANNTVDNIYFYVNGLGHDFNVTQAGTISSSTCSIDNMAKSTSYNQTTADATQSSTVINVISLLFIAFIVLIIVMGVVACVFILSGGVSQVASLASQIQQSQGGGMGSMDFMSLLGSSSGSGLNLGQLSSLASKVK